MARKGSKLALLCAALGLAGPASAGEADGARAFFLQRADHWLCLEGCPPALVLARFGFDSDRLSASDAARLGEVAAAAEALKSYEQAYEVACYTDAAGTPAYNLALSQRRAQAVADAFAKAGMTRPVVYSAKGAHPDAKRGAGARRVCEIEVAHTRSKVRD